MSDTKAPPCDPDEPIDIGQLASVLMLRSCPLTFGIIDDHRHQPHLQPHLLGPQAKTHQSQPRPFRRLRLYSQTS